LQYLSYNIHVVINVSGDLMFVHINQSTNKLNNFRTVQYHFQNISLDLFNILFPMMGRHVMQMTKQLTRLYRTESRYNNERNFTMFKCLQIKHRVI
jgi:hypothetical protein